MEKNMHTQPAQKDCIFIGMDLGTFKTSVASSIGTRDVLFSAVGWPRDHVARATLGRDVVFGQDLVDQRLALNVVRPFEKGVLKYNDEEINANPAETAHRKKAAQLLIQQAVNMTKPTKGMPIFGVIGAPARASVANKKIILEAARDTFDSILIVSEPFSIAYGMNRLTDTLVIDIGAGTIDLCPIYGTFPKEEDQVTLPIGGDYIDEQFMRLLKETYPEAQISLNMAREIKEKYGFVHDVNEKILVNLPVNGKPRQFNLTDPLKQACRMMVKPILEGLNELIGKFDPEFQSRLLHNIVLGGGGSQLKGLDRVIEDELKEYGGGKVKRVGDAVFAGAVGALKLAMGTPATWWNQLRTPADVKQMAA